VLPRLTDGAYDLVFCDADKQEYPDYLVAALRPLLEEGAERSQMVSDLAEARGRLLPGPGSDPIARVCDAAEELLGAGRKAAP